MVIDHFPAAIGVATGMTLEQALSRQSGGIILEADEAAYRRGFHRILQSLQGISDRVERAELGTAYVGLDGLETLYGGEARLVTALLNAVSQDLAPRAGVAEAKFPAYAAARISQALGATKVPQDAAGFLAAQPMELLPVPFRLRDELRRFGLRTLGDVAAMDVVALTDPFGLEGQLSWELAQAIDDTPLVPMKHEESVAERTALPVASASLELLLTAVDVLLRRVFGQPAMRGRYGAVRLWSASSFGPSPGGRTFASSSPWGTGGGLPEFCGANLRRTIPRPRWKRCPWPCPASPGNRECS